MAESCTTRFESNIPANRHTAKTLSDLALQYVTVHSQYGTSNDEIVSVRDFRKVNSWLLRENTVFTVLYCNVRTVASGRSKSSSDSPEPRPKSFTQPHP